MLARVTLLLGLLTLLLMPGSALAGGVGVFNGTGFHAGPALSEAGGAGTWINEGGGFELFFGKRDFRFHGRLRFFYNAVIDVTPLPDGVEARNRVGHSGALSVGAKVELLEDVEKPFGFYIATDIGISPLVLHLRNYFWVNAGPGVRVNVNDVFGLFAELTGVLRYENGFTGGAWMYLGARFSFD